MTHIHKFRLPIRYRHPNALRNLVWAVAIGLAAYGLWYSITEARRGYLLVTEAEARIAQAEAGKAELLAVLNGEVAMVDYAGKYAVIERVLWEVRK